MRPAELTTGEALTAWGGAIALGTLLHVVDRIIAGLCAAGML